MVLDPYDFAETMGYKNTGWLRQKHAKPLFAEEFKQMSEGEQQEHLAQEKPMYDTNIGNALYSLLKKEVIFTRRPRIYSQEKDCIMEFETVKMSILRGLTTSIKKSGKTEQVKTVYMLEMDERFLRSFTQYFIPGSISAVNALRASKLDILYAKLLELREYAEKQRIYLLTCDRIYGQETGEQRKYNMRGKAFEDFYRTAVNGRRKSNGLHGAVMEALSGAEC